jgi:hypothetical protein
MAEPIEPRMSAEELERTLEEYTREMTPDFLRKRLRLALYKKVQAGDISALADLKKLEAFEAAPPASPSAPSSPAPAPGEEGAPPELEEIGIPQRLLVKRHYTLTPAALEARRKNAQARRPGSEGNKRNWKSGIFAKDFIEGRIKPCLSTCEFFEDCELVSGGSTKPGGVCLDKAAVIQTYSAIMDAIKHKEYDDFNEVSGLMIAEIIHTCRTLTEDIMRDGGVVLREKYDKDGKLHTVEYVPHPNLMALPKIIADLGLTPREMNITPKAVKDGKDSEEQGKTLAGIMSDLNRRARGDQEKKCEGDED